MTKKNNKVYDIEVYSDKEVMLTNNNYYLSSRKDIEDIYDIKSNKISIYNYNAYGIIDTKVSGYSYTGEHKDNTGLIYLRARYYKEEYKQFITKDTYKGEITNPLSQNQYTYANNNPIKHIDPSGHFSLSGLANLANRVSKLALAFGTLALGVAVVAGVAAAAGLIGATAVAAGATALMVGAAKVAIVAGTVALVGGVTRVAIGATQMLSKDRDTYVEGVDNLFGGTYDAGFGYMLSAGGTITKDISKKIFKKFCQLSVTTTVVVDKIDDAADLIDDVAALINKTNDFVQSNGDSRILAKNLIETGIQRPINSAAHHIVAGFKNIQSAIRSRDILTKF